MDRRQIVSTTHELRVRRVVVLNGNVLHVEVGLALEQTCVQVGVVVSSPGMP